MKFAIDAAQSICDKQWLYQQNEFYMAKTVSLRKRLVSKNVFRCICGVIKDVVDDLC